MGVCPKAFGASHDCATSRNCTAHAAFGKFIFRASRRIRLNMTCSHHQVCVCAYTTLSLAVLRALHYAVRNIVSERDTSSRVSIPYTAMQTNTLPISQYTGILSQRSFITETGADTYVLFLLVPLLNPPISSCLRR